MRSATGLSEVGKLGEIFSIAFGETGREISQPPVGSAGRVEINVAWSGAYGHLHPLLEAGL